MYTLFTNAQILTMVDLEPNVLRGTVGVVDNRITLVSADESLIEAFKSDYPTAKIIDCKGKTLMPGLINTHTHVAMTLQRNSGDDTELMEWLTKLVWPFEALQSSDDIVAGTRLGIAEMLLGGTTSFIDMYWMEQHIAPVAKEMGIRALLSECCLDGVLPSFESNLGALMAEVGDSERVRAAVGPHAPYTCSAPIYQRCMEISNEHNLRFITHLAETQDECNTIRERYDMTPTEYLASCGVLSDKTILAHSIYLSDNDRKLIKESGAQIAHNPQCNMKISSGAAPITTLLEEGVCCGIGTDGVCSNNDLDMWDEMRSAALLQKHVTGRAISLPAYEVLRMATVNGARAMGFAGELGVIAEGALADIIVVDTTRPHYRPMTNVVSSLVYCGKAADVEYVMVDGKLLVEQKELLGVDLEAICCDVEQRAQAIFNKL